MKNIILALGILLFGLVFGRLSVTSKPLSADGFDAQAIEKDIIATLKRQDEAWNRGDIDAFMEDYLKSEELRFASGGDVNRGWQVTIDRYKTRYPDKAAMGTLSFTDLDVDVFSATDAMVFGRWSLARDADRPNGLFTLHMQIVNGHWVIVSDHTSSAD